MKKANRVYCLIRDVMGKPDRYIQQIECEKFAREKSWDIACMFFDHKHNDDLPALDRLRDAAIADNLPDALDILRDDAIAGRFDTLLVYSDVNIGRVLGEGIGVLRFMSKLGIQVYTVCDGEDISHEYDEYDYCGLPQWKGL